MRTGIELFASLALGVVLGMCGTLFVAHSNVESQSSPRSMMDAPVAVDDKQIDVLISRIGGIDNSIPAVRSDLSKVTSIVASGQKVATCVVSEPADSHGDHGQAGSDTGTRSAKLSAEQEALFEQVSQQAEYLLSVGSFSLPEFTESSEFPALTPQQQLQLMSGIAVRANKDELDIDSLFPDQ